MENSIAIGNHIIIVSKFLSKFYFLKHDGKLENTLFSFHDDLDDLDEYESLGKERDIVLIVDSDILSEDHFELCSQIHSNTSKHIYIIALSDDDANLETQQRLDEFTLDDFISMSIDRQEFYARLRLAFRMIELKRRVNRTQEKVALMSATDPVTQLSSRKRGREIIQNELARVVRGKQCLSLIMIDLDNFSKINEDFDERVGDAVLREVASRIRNSCRSYDSVIRWSGQEFLLISPDASEPDVLVVAQRIRFAIANKDIIVNPRVTVRVTASLGTVTVEAEDKVNISPLLDAASNALYRAKQDGRNCVRRATSIGMEN